MISGADICKLQLKPTTICSHTQVEELVSENQANQLMRAMVIALFVITILIIGVLGGMTYGA
jgi:hypothetical protein